MGMVVHTCNPSTCRRRQEDLRKLIISLFNILNSNQGDS